MDFAPMIKKLAGGKTCIVGMGNYQKRDDAAGLFVVDELTKLVRSDTVTIMNVEDVLENYVFKIAGLECENVIIVDAIESSAEVGSVLFGRLHEIQEIINNYSTHKLALTLSGKILEDHDKKVWLLGIEVRDTDFGTGLSDAVKESACLIRDIFLSNITGDQKEPVYEH